MKIYKLNADPDNYKGCFITHTKLSDNDLDKISTGEPLNFCDGSISFRFADKEGLKYGDAFNCWDFCGFLINDRTREIFSKNEKINAQFIKFEDNINLLNNLQLVDALDAEKTEFEYFETDIVGVNKYVFKEMDFPPLFQLTLPNGYAEIFYFVTDEFIKLVNENNIKGFLFKEM